MKKETRVKDPAVVRDLSWQCVKDHKTKKKTNLLTVFLKQITYII